MILAAALALSAAVHAAAPAGGLQIAQAQFNLARQVCAVAGPLEPASPPFNASELRRFELSQDRLRARCKDLTPIAGGLDALKSNLEPGDLQGSQEAGRKLDAAYRGLRQNWKALVEDPKERKLAGDVVESMRQTEHGVGALLDSLEQSFTRTLKRLSKNVPAAQAKPAAPDFSR